MHQNLFSGRRNLQLAGLWAWTRYEGLGREGEK